MFALRGVSEVALSSVSCYLGCNRCCAGPGQRRWRYEALYGVDHGDNRRNADVGEVKALETWDLRRSWSGGSVSSMFLLRGSITCDIGGTWARRLGARTSRQSFTKRVGPQDRQDVVVAGNQPHARPSGTLTRWTGAVERNSAEVGRGSALKPGSRRSTRGGWVMFSPALVGRLHL
jgi:hypothetical protein